MIENTTVVEATSGIIQVTGKLVIKNLVGVMAGFKPGKFIESEKFMLGDIPLAIKVYPNGKTDESKGHVSVFLMNKGDEDISVKSQIITDVKPLSIDYTDEPVKAGSGLGWPDFLTHADYTDAYADIDKDFVVTANVEMPGGPVVIAAGGGLAPNPRKFNLW